jgi:hypothetical protein
MKSRILAMAACLLLLTAVSSPLWADPLTPTVILTVKQPVEVPGHVLTSGQYYVSKLDLGDVVLIRSADGSQSFFELVSRASRPQPANDVVVDVAHQPGSVPRIMDYFFPGDTEGTAFLYPVHPQLRLAKKAVPHPHAS